MNMAFRVSPKSPAEQMLADAPGLALSDDQVQRAVLALRLEIGTKSERRQASELLRQIRRELLEGEAESEALARARGEGVVRHKDGRLEVSSRDGLKVLYTKGTLTRAQFEAGMLWRGWTEQLAGSAMVAAEWGSAGGGGLQGSKAYQLARRGQMVRRMSALAREISRMFPDGRAMRALVKVAGEGGCINDLTKSGSHRTLYRQNLIAALSIIAKDQGLSGGA